MPPLAHLRGRKSRALLSFLCLLVLLWIGLIGVRILLPLDYRDEILEWSTVNDLEPALVAAVIRYESSFRPQVISPAGAIGLMQIMPETGAWIAEQLDLSSYSVADLESPTSNIRLGTWYLRYLIDRFSRIDSALMAYNAGPTNADRWNGNLSKAFPETQRHVRRVQLSLPVYRAYFTVPWLLDLIPSLHF